DPSRFLQGAKVDYETIVKAFASGDREALRKLVSPLVMAGFENDIAGGEVEGDISRARVRFLAEFRSRSKGPEGEAVDDRRTAEVWTFERRLSSRDPNWTLIHVDPAEA